MIKNIMLGVMTVLVAGWVVIYSFPAQADRRRDEWQIYDRMSTCTVYSKNMRNGDTMYLSNCSIAIGQ